MRNIFGNKLKEAREVLGLSQRELAQRTKLSCAAICLLENGQTTPAWKTLIQIVGVIPLRIDPLLKKEIGAK